MGKEPNMTRSDHTESLSHWMHTPGPWHYDLDYIVAPDPNGRHPDIYIAEIAHSDDEERIASLEQQDANRRLIAAAPELLWALVVTTEYLIHYVGAGVGGENKRSRIKKARAAIAKATGRAA
jgi:hypothetical protein